MKFLDAIAAEHRLIDAVAGALRAWAEAAGGDGAEPADGERFVRFFRDFAGGFHHAREEGVLFPALVREAELRADAGPLAALTAQHRAMERALETLAGLVAARASGAPLVAAVHGYLRPLGQHIDAEDSVLLPESATRLQRAGVLELPEVEPSAAALAARADGELLVGRYPASADPEGLRGEGCVVCPSFGDTCQGVEREWWSELEWEDFHDRVG